MISKRKRWTVYMPRCPSPGIAGFGEYAGMKKRRIEILSEQPERSRQIGTLRGSKHVKTSTGKYKTVDNYLAVSYNDALDRAAEYESDTGKRAVLVAEYPGSKKYYVYAM